MSAVVALRTEPAALSPARAELRRTIEVLAAAMRAYEAAQAPANRLSSIITEHDQAVAELKELRQRDEAVLGEWLAAGGEFARPEPSVETLAAERRVAALARDAAAAQAAKPRVEAELRTATEAVHAAHAARDEALHAVAAEAAERVIAELHAKRCDALAIEAKILGLIEELQRRGNAGNHSARVAVERLRGAVRHAKESAAAPRNDEAGRRLLDALITDPAAELE